MSKPETTSRTVKSDQTLIDLLEVLRDEGKMGVTELSSELGFAKSSVHKHLQTLYENGYVLKEPDGYRLSFKFLRFTAHARDRNQLFIKTRPKLYEIASELDEFVTFAIEEQGRSVFVHAVNDKYDFTQNLPLLGSRCYMHQNAAGKAMLAEFSDERVREIAESEGLPGVTDRTITEVENLLEEIEQIREQKYALNIEERTPILRSVAVSVKDPRSDTIGAVSVAGPAKQLSREVLETEYAPRLLRLADNLELQLEYR